MVELVEQNFEKNKKIYHEKEIELKSVFGEDADIHHVGSTAIPDMFGKNIIDILFGVDDGFDKTAQKLQEMGYFASPKKGEIYQFFASRKEETKSGDVHIHLVKRGTERYSDFLVLKNYLLDNPKIAKEYSEHKKQLLKQGVFVREKYRETKSKFVLKLIQKAREIYKK